MLLDIYFGHVHWILKEEHGFPAATMPRHCFEQHIYQVVQYTPHMTLTTSPQFDSASVNRNNERRGMLSFYIHSNYFRTKAPPIYLPLLQHNVELVLSPALGVRHEE